MDGLGLKVWGFGCRIEGLGCGIQGFVCRVCSRATRFGVKGLFWVWGVGFVRFGVYFFSRFGVQGFVLGLRFGSPDRGV